MTAPSSIAPPEPVRLLLNGLHGVRRSGAGWMARCPAHDDRQASLSVTTGEDGRALVYCHAGCLTEAVVGAAGLTTADLFEPRVAPVPRPSRRPSDKPTLYPVRDAAGVPVAIHVREDTANGKRLAWRLPDGSSGLGGIRTADLPLFGSEHIGTWDASHPVLIVEGEKAAVSLLSAGFRALGTVTGASSSPSAAVLELLRDRHVIVWPDADKAGSEHMARIGDRLAGIAASVRLLTWPDAPEHGDAADLLNAGSAADVDRLIATARPLTAPGPVLLRLSHVERERVTWIWDRYLARGKLHIVEGDPGLGKSTLLLDLAARLSTGADLPDGGRGSSPVGTVILTAEDGLGDTVRPRLEAAGADLERIVALAGIVDGDGERMPGLPADLGAVEAAITSVAAALVIIDPLVAFLDPDVNSWRDQDVRRALAPLSRLAERTDCGVVALRHLNKSAGSHAMYRGGGSIGIIGAARVGLLVAPDPDDAERRILATVKNNLAAHPPSLAFRLVGDDATGAARIEWLGESHHGASALLAIPADDEERSGVEEAADVLRVILAEGPMPAREAEREARSAGITDATLRRARKAAGVVAERVGGLGSDGRWQWSLAAKALTETLRRSYPDGERLSTLMSALASDAPAWNGASDERHDCARCHQPADDIDLIVVAGAYKHREPSRCATPAS